MLSRQKGLMYKFWNGGKLSEPKWMYQELHVCNCLYPFLEF